MKRFRFAFVSNSEEVAEAVQTHADPSIEHVALNLATMEAALPVARQLLADGVEVIIGGGGTGGLLAESIGQPVVKLDRSSIDLLRALIQARKVGSDIAITSFGRPIEGIDLYQELLSVRIRQVVFSRSEELRAGIREAIGNGCRVVVGGGICRQIATRCGASGIVLMPRKENIVQTLREARAIAAARRMERRSLEEIRAILLTVREGIIVVDKDANVKFFNAAAIEIFRPVLPNADQSALVGNRIPGVLEPMGLAKVLRDGIPETDQVRRVGPVDLVVSSLPIMIDCEMVGVISTIREASRIQRLDRKVREKLYAKGFVAKHTFDQIRRGSPSMGSVLDRARRYAATDAAILIEGETGTGKELLAQSIHNASRRHYKPFLGINCSALPESLLESELFGYEEGAFTGARRGGKIGLFELANAGTLFLDEIADISASLQVRLLRVIEEGEIMRLGGDRIVPVDVRVISSSQKDLFQVSEQGQFRPDLYFRLATLRLRVPPLRERTQDFAALLVVLFARHGREHAALPEWIHKALATYDWPGNIRELDAVVRTYLALEDRPEFDQKLFLHVFDELHRTRRRGRSETADGSDGTGEEFKGSLRERLRRYEAQVIRQTLEDCRYNRTETARQLGISVNSLWRKSKG